MLALLIIATTVTTSAAAGTSFCPMENRGNVLTSGLRGGGNACNPAGTNVPTDACSSSRSASGDEEGFTTVMVREEEFGRQTYGYVKALETGELGPKPWFDPNAKLDPPKDRCDIIELTNKLPNAAGNSYYDGPVVAYDSANSLINNNFKTIRSFSKKEFEGITRKVSTDSASHPWQAEIQKICPSVEFGNALIEGAPDSFEDGRCYGEPFSHQRWEEFYPRRVTKTIMTGAQRNSGLRDQQQLHQYANGEFSVKDNGLYAFTGAGDGFTQGMRPQWHPEFAEQDRQSLWTFDGTFPPKLMIARYGESVMLRHYNGLSLSYDCNRGYGSHFISTHEHNGHTPAESDGFANSYFLPGQYYDYHWPMILAGHDSINNNAAEEKASTPCTPLSRVGDYSASNEVTKWDDNGHMVISYPGNCELIEGKISCYSQTTTANAGCAARNGGDLSCCAIGDPNLSEESQCCSDDNSWCFMNQGLGDHGRPWHRLLMACPEEGRIKISGDYRETMSTHWFHDHMLDNTAQNVYKGNAAMMNYYSAIDRGNECWHDGVNLRLPSGCGMKYNVDKDLNGGIPSELSWGLRDYDLNIVLGSKAWGQDTQGYYGGNFCNETTSNSAACKDQLWMARFNGDGMLGDRMLVNWIYKPFFPVRPRRYRFRLLNGDVSRFMKLASVLEFDCDDPTKAESIEQLKADNNFFEGKPGENKCYQRIPFHMIGTDGNILPHAIPFDGTMDLWPESRDISDVMPGNMKYYFDNSKDGCNRFLGISPTFAIAERLDLIFDFSICKPGDKVFFVNIMEHEDGRRPRYPNNIQGGVDMLRNILDGSYVGDGAADKMLRLDVVDALAGAVDTSMNPKDYEPPCMKNGVNYCACPKVSEVDKLRRLSGKTMINAIPIDLDKVSRTRTMEYKHGGAELPTRDNQGENLLAIGEIAKAPIPNSNVVTDQIVTGKYSVNHDEEEYVKKNFFTPENGCISDECVQMPWSIRTNNGGRKLSSTIEDHVFETITTKDVTNRSDNRNLRSLQNSVILRQDRKYLADLHLLQLAPVMGTLEKWTIGGNGGWSHNVHTHFEEGRLIDRGGQNLPAWEQGARKDVYRVGPLEESTHDVTFVIAFRDFAGTYMTHCHNTQHEDKAMLQRWDVENPGQLMPFLNPIPSWSGCSYQSTQEMEMATQRQFNGGNGATGGNEDDKREESESEDEDERNSHKGPFAEVLHYKVSVEGILSTIALMTGFILATYAIYRYYFSRLEKYSLDDMQSQQQEIIVGDIVVSQRSYDNLM